MTIAVDTIQGHPLGAWPHVGKEVFEFVPSVADDNAARTIQRGIWCLGVMASLQHARPRGEFSALRHAMRPLFWAAPALPRHTHQVVGALTAAAEGFAVTQSELRHTSGFAAIAPAPPSPVARIAGRFRQNREMIDPEAGEIERHPECLS